MTFQTFPWPVAFLLAVLSDPAIAEVKCASEPDAQAAKYCRGMSSDEIIHLRDRRWQQIEVRLSMLPGLIEEAANRVVAARAEHAEKVHAHGYLRGRLTEIRAFLAVVESQATGMAEVRTGLARLRALPEGAVPALLATLRSFLAEREELLDDEISRRKAELERTSGDARVALEFSLSALRELKALRHSRPESAAELLRRPLSRESLEADISPFSRALFAAALETEEVSGKASGTLQFLEATVGRLADRLAYERERQVETIAQLSVQAEAAGATLNEAGKRAALAADHLAKLHAEREALRREREEIPGRIRHLDWMHQTGCDRSTMKTVCRDYPEPKPGIDRPCLRCFVPAGRRTS